MRRETMRKEKWEERTKCVRTPFLLTTTQSSFTSKESDQPMLSTNSQSKTQRTKPVAGPSNEKKDSRNGWGISDEPLWERAQQRSIDLKNIFFFHFSSCQNHFQMIENQPRLGIWEASSSYLQSTIFYCALQNEFIRKCLFKCNIFLIPWGIQLSHHDTEEVNRVLCLTSCGLISGELQKGKTWPLSKDVTV